VAQVVEAQHHKPSKVVGSILVGVIGIFHWHNPSGCAMALGSIQPLTKMSTWNISWVKAACDRGRQLLPISCVDCLKILAPQPPDTLKACQGV
jgi:hypothetical protein